MGTLFGKKQEKHPSQNAQICKTLFQQWDWDIHHVCPLSRWKSFMDEKCWEYTSWAIPLSMKQKDIYKIYTSTYWIGGETVSFRGFWLPLDSHDYFNPTILLQTKAIDQSSGGSLWGNGGTHANLGVWRPKSSSIQPLEWLNLRSIRVHIQVFFPKRNGLWCSFIYVFIFRYVSLYICIHICIHIW